MKPGLIGAFFLVVACTAFPAGSVRYDAIDVSMVRLIAAPQEYSKKLVRIVGFLNIEFEGNAIYLHEEDFKHSLTANAFGLTAKPEMMEELKRVSGQYVIIEGVFEPSDRGHMSLFSGTVCEINRADVWRPRRTINR